MAGLEVAQALIPARLKFSVIEDEQDSDGEQRSDRIPFSQNKIFNCRTSESTVNGKVLNMQNKENKASPLKISSSPRSNSKSRHPLEDPEIIALNSDKDTENQLCIDTIESDRPVTPTTNSGESENAPLTPTANLKMLFSAMSPEIRDREKKRDEFRPENEDSEDSQHCLMADTADTEILGSQESDSGKAGSRKEKSLGLLCQKFLQKYPEYPDETKKLEICLDEVAKELCVERRRIYDIVNVLESVEIVSRVAKNKYAWHGKSNLVTTLSKLKALGEAEGFVEQIQQVRDHELTRELEEQSNTSSTTSSHDVCNGSSPESPESGVSLPTARGSLAFLRKDKSLGIMSQKFLMLFLVSKPKTVNLDLSAKILIGDPNVDRTENAKFKTKIRRLYDIANILTSLDLIRKVHVTEIRGRKPAFKYIGPDLESIHDLHKCCNDGCHRPSSRHSMLDCVQNQNVANLVTSYQSLPPVPRTASGRVLFAEDKSKVSELKRDAAVSSLPKKLSRHASFEQICQVAESERKKLYASSSQPSSPVKELTSNCPPEKVPHKKSKDKPTTSSTKNGKQFILMESSGGQFHVVECKESKSQSNSQAAHKLPVQSVQKKTNVAQPKVPSSLTEAGSSSQETIIIKTKLPANNTKPPTMIALSKDQIDAVLRSLKIPVPVSKESSSTVDAGTQVSEPNISTETSISPDNLKTTNEQTPVYNSNQLKRSCPQDTGTVPAIEKRLKLDFLSPCSETNNSPDITQKSPLKRRLSSENREKPSPQRALHLAPEFRALPPTKMPKISSELGSDTELASPLQESEDSPNSPIAQTSVLIEQPNGKPQEISVQRLFSVPKSNIQKVTVQLPNQPPTILHVPLMGLPSKDQNSPKVVSSFLGNNNISQAQPMQILQGVPVNSNGQIQGQPVNIMLPAVTLSPPLTPNSNPSSPNLFTFPGVSQPNVTYTSVHLVQPSGQSGKVPAAQVISKVNAPSTTITQFVSPTERPIVTPAAFFGNTPGGFIPVTSSLNNRIGLSSFPQDTVAKGCISTVRKLSLPDISL